MSKVTKRERERELRPLHVAKTYPKLGLGYDGVVWDADYLAPTLEARDYKGAKIVLIRGNNESLENKTSNKKRV